ncbi:MAG: response regulator [Myxococcota bacterium]
MAADPYRYFRVEARELVAQLGGGVLELERDAPSGDLMARLLRGAHTLKGAARVMRLAEIADRAHAFEDALSPHRETKEPVPQETLEVLLALVDELSARLARLDDPPQGASVDPAPSACAAGAAQEPGARGAEPRTVRAQVTDVDALLDALIRSHAQVELLRSSEGALEQARHRATLLAEQLVARGRGSAAGDRTLALAKEVAALVARSEGLVATGAERIDRLLQQARGSAEQLRLASAGSLFPALERLARDTARALGKRIAVVCRGGDVRIDASVLEQVQAALVQIVRNAAVHGIEVPSERQAAGKPGEGRLTLDVIRRGRRVVFRCGDDGRGVDLDAVRRAAERQGVGAQRARELGRGELLRLVLQGGLTTSSVVTQLAGRGVGLDVVRETATRLGGEVELETDPGAGTVIELFVPIELASARGLIVESDGASAVIPLASVRRAVRVEPGDRARSADGDAIVCDGELVPFLPLRRALGLAGSGASRNGTELAVIVHGSDGLVALGIGRILGSSDVVIRRVPELAPFLPGLAGLSVLGDGEARPVLDPDALVREGRRSRPSEAAPTAPRQPVLVVDDSLTTRMLEQSILESAGYEVEVATCAEEALELARSRCYALFLVDVEMPGMDGFEFVSRLRADPSLRDVPAILITSRGAAEDRQRGVEVGAQGFVVKSEFDQRDLLARIAGLVGSAP